MIHPPHDLLDVAALEAELLSEAEANPLAFLAAMERKSNDDELAIEASIDELVEKNDCRPSYMAGKTLGRLVADCHRYERYIHDMHFDPEESVLDPSEIGWSFIAAETFSRSVVDKCKEILANRGGMKNRYSDLLVANLGELALVTGKTLSTAEANKDYSDTSPAMGWLAQVRQVVGIVIGEMLSELRDADKLVWEKDSQAITPRMFRLGKDSAPERVAGQIFLIEKELNERTGSSLSPESMVSMLVNGVEALVRQAWPREFSQESGRNGVDKVLDNKSRSADDMEMSFANTARHLFKTYRNAAVHDLSRFECSPQEARFFLAGMQVLLEKSRKLQSRK